MENSIKEKTIVLSDEYFIGQGYHKKCYINPENSMLCVKILHNTGDEAQKQLDREMRYNERLKEQNIPILPGYHGEISTNMGKGYVFELIKNGDGSAPYSISEYLASDMLLQNNFSNLADKLKVLKQNMLSHKIITMALYPQNILCQNGGGHTITEETRLVIIDDIGSAALIPIEYYFAFAARAKVKRKWGRFVDYIEKKYKNPLAQKLAKEIR